MKTLFAIQLFLFILTSLITVNVFGQLLPDPGSDPLYGFDSVGQTSNIKSINPNLIEARNSALSKRHLPQLGKTLSYATDDNHEKRQEQQLKKKICYELLLAASYIYKLN
jgi:hypothetical protein